MNMEDQMLIEQVREAISDILLVLQKNNIDVVHVGALMRLLGIDDRLAAKHDGDRLVIKELLDRSFRSEVPIGTTIH